jgi:hypothetical protein
MKLLDGTDSTKILWEMAAVYMRVFISAQCQNVERHDVERHNVERHNVEQHFAKFYNIEQLNAKRPNTEYDGMSNVLNAEHLL